MIQMKVCHKQITNTEVKHLASAVATLSVVAITVKDFIVEHNLFLNGYYLSTAQFWQSFYPFFILLYISLAAANIFKH